MTGDPLAFLLTWVTYGTWLPGDARDWVEYQAGWQLPDPIRELEAMAIMTEEACRLTPTERQAVESQIAQTCQHRGWHLHAVNCRSNHVHVVVTAPGASTKKVLSDLKAWATRCLKNRFDSKRENWWAERGSVRFLNSDASLEGAVVYVLDAQDRVGRDVEKTVRNAESCGRSPSLTRRVSQVGDDQHE